MTNHSTKIESYYRFHSRIYDATRWSFLFGRQSILDKVPVLPSRPRIMEVGCGTGKNIVQMQSIFPDAQILGIDLSEDMLDIARSKAQKSENTNFLNIKYGSQPVDEKPFDVILLSYSLTMIGSSMEKVIDELLSDLRPGCFVAVVDFHATPLNWFRRWMSINHVKLNGQLLPLLKKHFEPVKVDIKPAYLGLWSYFQFIGQPK